MDALTAFPPGAIQTGPLDDAQQERVERLRKSMLALPQPDCPVRHFFVRGIYARQITMPAHTGVIGVRHKKESLVTISQGSLSVLTMDGVQIVRAPCTWVCKPGTQNALATHDQDVVWTNYFHTFETDIDKLIEELSYSKAEELLGGEKNQQLLFQKLNFEYKKFPIPYKG